MSGESKFKVGDPVTDNGAVFHPIILCGVYEYHSTREDAKKRVDYLNKGEDE